MSDPKSLDNSGTPALAAAGRADGWVQLAAGLGDPKRDKRMSAYLNGDRLTYDGLRQLYTHNDLAKTIVDRPAADMVREWFDVKAEKSKGQVEKIEQALDELDAAGKFRQALEWKRAYGGALILVGANDGAADLSRPLDETKIQAIDYLNVFDTREARVLAYYENPLAPKYGEPLMYQIEPRALGTGVTLRLDVHESRVLRFCGPVPSRDTLIFTQGWGESALQACHEVVRDVGLSWESAAALILDFSLAIYKVRGLAEAMASDNEQLVLKRLQAIELSKSVVRGVILDAEGEDYERKPTPITGLPDLLDRFMQRLSAAARMPVSLVFGKSSGGLNADSAADGDLRFYYDDTAHAQRREVVPPLRRLAHLLQLAKRGPTKGRVLANWSVCARPLWQMDDLQKADMRLKMAQADAAYVSAGVLLPEEIAQSRFGGDTFSLDTQLMPNRDAVLEEKEAANAEAELAMLEAKAAAGASAKPGADE